MQDERDSFVLVPNARRSALLVAGGKLPRVRSRSGAAGVIEALQAHSLHAPYLRPARILWDEMTRQASSALYEFDAPDAEWEPLAAMEWLALDDVDPEMLSPPRLAPYVEKWLAIMRGSPIPEARPAWARPGWLAEASSWMEKSMVEAGLRPVGPVEVVEQWPLSSVLRRGTEDGHVYMKAVFSTFHHEPALTQALATVHPKLVPDVLAVDILVHGDLHPGNVMVDGDELRIFDWSDACVSHPFFDLPTFLTRASDEVARELMLGAYLDAWTDLASLDALRAAYELALPLAHVHHAVSYLRINEALEPDDCWWFADEPKRWLAGAVELLDAA